MTETLTDKEPFLAQFAQLEDEDAPAGWIGDLRRRAIERFDELGFPNTHQEEWRFTNLSPLTAIAFAAAPRARLSSEQLRRASLVAGDGIRLVIVNGRYAPELSSLANLPAGVRVTSLAALGGNTRELESALAQYARYEEHPFVALNTAFLRDAAIVQVAEGASVAAPIHLVFAVSPSDEPIVCHPRGLVMAGANSRVTLVESYVGVSEGVYFSNAVTELIAGENAVVDHYKIQTESRAAFHLGTLQVEQERGSVFSTHLISLGGGLVRNEVNAALNASGCECTLNGLYAARGRQQVDNHTVIDHAKPNCTSHELFKGILDGRARGVFNGRILVRQDAQKTDAKQTNKTLLLSEDATINAQPQLEIYADDVKCTHGATVGQLEDEALFYLRSRGLGLDAARALLTFAFANDIIGRVKVEPIRSRLEGLFLAGFSGESDLHLEDS